MFGLIRSSLLLGLLCSTALAANPSGTAVRVSQNAKAAGNDAGARVLLTQGAVFAGDQITTDYQGTAQIIFVDNTRFVVGPNSRATIDRFVFNPDNTARTLTITATKGAFRFITGASAHQAYLIRTPAMTIGVRGTALDFTVETGTGRVTEAVYQGATNNCDSSNHCVINDDVCGIVIALPGNPVALATGDERQEALSRRLPFLGSLSQVLLADFRPPTSACGVNARSNIRTNQHDEEDSDDDSTPPRPIPTDSSPSGGGGDN